MSKIVDFSPAGGGSNPTTVHSFIRSSFVVTIARRCGKYSLLMDSMSKEKWSSGKSVGCREEVRGSSPAVRCELFRRYQENGRMDLYETRRVCR